jgi:hypothetical protein
MNEWNEVQQIHAIRKQLNVQVYPKANDIPFSEPENGETLSKCLPDHGRPKALTVYQTSFPFQCAMPTLIASAIT